MIDLMTRSNNGIEVTLYWDKNTDRTYLNVKDTLHWDEAAPEERDWTVPVPPDEAMEAFNHPYMYETPSYVPTIGDLPNDGALA